MSDDATVRPLRLGLVGCGRLAEAGYLPALEGVPRVRLVAVADPDRRRRVRAAGLGSPGGAPVATYAGGGDLIAAGGVDAVVIASPPESHLGDAEEAAAAGLAALVEKPPAPDGPGAQRLAGLRPRPWIGFNRRFDRGAALRDLVPPDGELELGLELRYRRASWRPYTVAVDALADIGPHLVDLALFVGRAAPRAVRRARLKLDRARLELVTTRGVATIRCATDRVHAERVRVRAAGGATIAEHAVGGVAGGVLARVRRRPQPLVASLALQLEAFARAARGGQPAPLADAADGVAVMAVLDAARASADRDGAEVAIEPAMAAAAPGVEAAR